MKISNKIRSIAIGSFDGMHLAHQKIIAGVEHIVVIERQRGLLTPGYKRTLYSDKSFSFYLYEKIRDLSAAEFVKKLADDYPALEKIAVGYDFCFGRNREGDTLTLKRSFGGEVTVADEIRVNGIPVHSRTICRFLSEGDIDLANQLLGRRYIIDGEITPGQGIGRRRLVPTINLSIEEYQLPGEGVYITRTKTGNVWYPSVSFIGHRRTLDGSFAVETHLLNREIDIRTGSVSVEFCAFLRENIIFSSIDKLREQIVQDISDAELFFGRDSYVPDMQRYRDALP